MFPLGRLAALAAIIANVAIAVPFESQSGKISERAGCKTLEQRKAWRNMKDAEKLAFIDAELCLMKLPSTSGYPGAVTRWDDLQAGHVLYSHISHDVGAFMPWHRYYVHAHMQILKSECGYTGIFPYWEQRRDIGAMADSSLFDREEGFGGNGQGPNNCVVDGPFANTTLHLGPGYQTTDYCMNRVFNPAYLDNAAQDNVDVCLAHDNHADMTFCMEGLPHVAGHVAVGGMLIDVVASPGDPVFYMIHGYLDKLWWDWQSEDLSNRLTDMGGRNVPTQAYREQFGLREVSAEWLARDGDPGDVTTLDHVLDIGPAYPPATVRDVMDIKGGFLCYEYV